MQKKRLLTLLAPNRIRAELQVLLCLTQVVISDVPDCGGWKYAAEHSIPTIAYPASSKTSVEGKQIGLSTEDLISGLKEHHGVDFVLLAGYLKVCSPLLTCKLIT